MGDGKLVFDTKIDTSGFERDAKKLEGAKVSLGIDGEGVKKDIEEAVQAVNPSPVKIEADADTAPAKQTTDDFEPSPVKIETDADTAPAKQTTDDFEPEDKEIKVSADMTGADEAMKSLDEKLYDWADKNATLIGTAIGNFVGNIINEFIGNIWNGIQEAAGAGDEIDKNSQKMGLSREGYQEWGYVLRQNGSDVKSLQSGMTQLNTVVDKAKKGSKDASKPFSKLGLEIKDLNKMSREEVFNAVVKGLQGIDDEGEKAAIATELFGDSAVELLPTLNQASSETAALKKEAHDLGAVMSDEAVDASVEFNDSLDKMQTAWDGVSTQLMTLVMPLFTGFFDLVGGIIGGINNLFAGPQRDSELYKELDAAFGKADDFKAAIDKLKTDYSNTMIDITVKYKKSEDLIEDLQALQAEGTLTEDEIKKMQDISASLVELYPGLKDYVGADGIIHAEAKEIQTLIEKWKSLDEQIAMSSYILGIESASMGMDVELKGYEQLADNKYKAWQDAIEETKKGKALLNTSETVLERITWYAVPEDVKAQAVSDAQTFLQDFQDAYSEEFTAMQLPNVWDLINMPVEEILNNQDLSNSLAEVVGAIQTKLDEMVTSQESKESDASAVAAMAIEKYQNAVTEYSGTMENLTALQQAYLETFFGYTDETIAARAKDNETMAQTVNRLYEETLKDAEDTTAALNSEGEQQDEAVEGMKETAEEAETASDDTITAASDQQEAIDGLETQALTVEQLAADIQTALDSGKTAEEALASAKAKVTEDAAAILDEMKLYVEDLGTYVGAMTETMVQTVDDAKTDAAKAGRNFAKGAADGYEEKPVLNNAVDASVRQSIDTLRAYYNNFYAVGVNLIQQVADGLTSNSGALGQAMADAAREAVAAAQSAIAGNSVFHKAERWYRHRAGLEYVPYDEYPALLHKGESVLTTSEAALWRGGMYALDLTPEPVDYDALADAIWRNAPEDGGGIAISVNLDGEEVASVLEPSISALQGRRLSMQRR